MAEYTTDRSSADPDQGEYQQPFLTGVVDWDRVKPIKQALRDLDNGQFLGASLLCELVLRDDSIRGKMATRIDGLLSKPLEWEAPVGTGSKGEEVAAAARIDWPKIAPKSTQRKLMRWGRLVNLGVGEMVWDTRGPRWLPRIKVWHPQFATWYPTEERLRLITLGIAGQPEREQLVALPRLDREPNGDGKWLLYTPNGYDYCWREGDVAALATLFLIRQWCLRDWARKNEVYGLGIRVVSVPATLNDEDKQRLVRRIRNLGSETTFEAPMGSDGAKVSLELIESQIHGAETFGELMDRLDAAVGSLLTGANASGPKVSSLGNGQEHQDENVRGDLIAADADIGPEVWTAQVMHWWTRHNFGDESLTPNAVFRVDPPKSLKATAEGLASLATALPALAAAGADTRKILEENDIPLLPVAAAPAPGAPTPQPAAPGAPPTPPAPSATPAPASPSTAALDANGDRVSAAPVIDDTIARATAAGQAALQGYLDGILEEVRGAGDFEQLKQRLLVRFKDADPARLAAVLEKSMLLAELFGRAETIRHL